MKTGLVYTIIYIYIGFEKVHIFTCSGSFSVSCLLSYNSGRDILCPSICELLNYFSPSEIFLPCTCAVCGGYGSVRNINSTSMIDVIFDVASSARYECTYVYRVADETMSFVVKSAMYQTPYTHPYTISIGYGDPAGGNVMSRCYRTYMSLVLSMLVAIILWRVLYRFDLVIFCLVCP